MLRKISKIVLILVLLFPGLLLGWGHNEVKTGPIGNGIDKMVLQLENGLGASNRLKIAVADFCLERTGVIDPPGQFLSELLEMRLSKSPRFAVMDHHHIRRILERKKLEMSDLYDAATVKRLGDFVGVDGFLIGSYWDCGDGIMLMAKLVDVKTAEQVASATVTLFKGDIPERYHPSFTKKRISSPTIGDRYTIEAYQIDEVARIFVNDSLVCAIDIPVGSPRFDYDNNFKKIDISSYLKPGENLLRFVVLNRRLPMNWGRCGYGFKILKNRKVIWQAARKYPRSYDPDGVFYDQFVKINIEQNNFF